MSLVLTPAPPTLQQKSPSGAKDFQIEFFLWVKPIKIGQFASGIDLGLMHSLGLAKHGRRI